MIRMLLCALLLLVTIPASAWDAQLNWKDNSTVETGQKIDRRLGESTSTAPWVEVGSVAPDSVSYKDVGLLPDQWYCWRVRSVNQAGSSGPSNSVCFGSPAPPSGLLLIVVIP